MSGRVIPLPENRRRLVYLIACSSRKRRVPSPARDLYRGVLFQKSLAFAEAERPHGIHILSAEHGLVGLDDVLAPYDLSLASVSAAKRKLWGIEVGLTLDALYPPSTARPYYVLLAGEVYRNALTPHLRGHWKAPLSGGIGLQQRWLNDHTLTLATHE
ncbi:MAG: DUF6884 domain-containing protein [Bacteroidota bacterium]